LTLPDRKKEKKPLDVERIQKGGLITGQIVGDHDPVNRVFEAAAKETLYMCSFILIGP
jgi:hypothetical protein